MQPRSNDATHHGPAHQSSRHDPTDGRADERTDGPAYATAYRIAYYRGNWILFR